MTKQKRIKLIKKISKKEKLGIIFAVGFSLFQSFEALLFPLFSIFIAKAIYESPSFSGAILGGKELMGIILMVPLFGTKTFKKAVLNLRNRGGQFYALAGFIGTSFGNLFYILGIAMAGSGYGVMLTALYPVFSVFFIRIIMRKKENKWVWIGAFISTVSAILFVLLPIAISENNSFSYKEFLGILFGAIAAVFWAIEGVLIKMGIEFYKKKKIVTHENEIVIMRGIFTTIATFFIIMPFMFVFKSNKNSFQMLWEISSSWKTFLLLLIMTINVTILRYLHIKAIALIGPKITSVIDTNNFWLPSFFILFLQFTNFKTSWGKIIYQPIIWESWFFVIPIFLGILMVILNSKK